MVEFNSDTDVSDDSCSSVSSKKSDFRYDLPEKSTKSTFTLEERNKIIAKLHNNLQFSVIT
jgi:hypothetical protein